MDMHDRNSHINNKTQRVNTNRVYINPYFNSNYTNNTYGTRENASMHVNPNFTAPISTSDNKQINKSKIFINPNFVKSVWGNASSTECHESIQHNSQNNARQLLESNMKPTKNDLNLPLQKINKSRYSLVRYGTTNVKENVKENQSKTIKVNRYKSVPLADYKKNIMRENNIVKTCSNLINAKTLPQSLKNMTHSGLNKKYVDIYKYVKCKSASITFDGCKKSMNSKTIIASARKNYKLRIKTKGVFKKNNIPCPLFKKFGKCLRNIHGNCEFLHDKKHVMLCRKFLKGICFDTECLLSHDVSTKKMPTCYFYLRGMCTKVDCPYVHIKLNDDTKTCPDFLKGYCERGKKCSNRHVTIIANTETPTYYKYKRNEKSKLKKKSMSLENKHKNIPTKLLNDHNVNHSKKQEENFTEGRYYDDQGKWKDDTKDGTSESIKPTRCKLGTLPSFIQLHN